jgi:hypothetical protein
MARFRAGPRMKRAGAAGRRYGADASAAPPGFRLPRQAVPKPASRFRNALCPATPAFSTWQGKEVHAACTRKHGRTSGPVYSGLFPITCEEECRSYKQSRLVTMSRRGKHPRQGLRCLGVSWYPRAPGRQVESSPKRRPGKLGHVGGRIRAKFELT